MKREESLINGKALTVFRMAKRKKETGNPLSGFEKAMKLAAKKLKKYGW